MSDQEDNWISDYVPKPENLDELVMRDGRVFDLRNIVMRLEENQAPSEQN